MRAQSCPSEHTHGHPLSQTNMMSRALRACRHFAGGRAGQGAAACGLSRALVAVGATTTGAMALTASSASCAGARAGSLMPPFHLAIPVHDLDEAKAFYGEVLGLSEGRSSAKWQDYSMYGHQLVVHYVGEAYRVRHCCPALGGRSRGAAGAWRVRAIQQLRLNCNCIAATTQRIAVLAGA